MNDTTLSRVSLPIAQVGAVLVWFVLASIPGTVWRVPDAVLETLLPGLIALLGGAGAVALVRARRIDPALIVGTALCAVCLALVVALIFLVPTSLRDF